MTREGVSSGVSSVVSTDSVDSVASIESIAGFVMGNFRGRDAVEVGFGRRNVSVLCLPKVSMHLWTLILVLSFELLFSKLAILAIASDAIACFDLCSFALWFAT